MTQYFGTVEVEAHARKARHFEVQTPFLAAVVKGTRFIVTSGQDQSSVEVKRGRVDVTDKHTGLHALVPAGQAATVTQAGEFALKGRGASETPVLGADDAVVGTGGVSASVAASAGGVSVNVTTPSGVSVSVTPGKGGASVTTPAGNVGSGGGGVGVGVGKLKLNLF